MLPFWEHGIINMRVIALQALRQFWEQHPEAQDALLAWYHDVKRAHWHTPGDIKAVYRNASFVGSNRVIFNIKGNQYRVVVAVRYDYGIVYIRFVGTHSAYDEIDAASV